MKYMWFGTQERMSWIPCPAVDVDLSKVGWATSGRYLNGGGYSDRSATAGKVYQFGWNLMSGSELRKVMDYADGLYGQGPFYFIDPFSRENILPQYWAAPRLAAEDGPPLIVDTRPTLVATTANTYAYPTKSAVYTLTGTDAVTSLWLPVPEGYTLHVGVHGTATDTARLTVTPDGGAAADVTILAVTTSTLTNHTVVGPTGVTLALAGSGTLTLAGLIAAVASTGQAAPTGLFVSGQGHSGCDFDKHPTESGYSSALDKKGASATLIEVGAWL